MTENFISEIWLPLWDNTKKRKMSEDETSIMFTLLMSGPNKEIDYAPLEKSHFIFGVLVKRATAFTKNIVPKKTILMLATISHSIGSGVMCLHYFEFRGIKEKKETVTIEDLCDWFPNGFPTEEELSKLWDLQKGHKNPGYKGVDNILDIDSSFKNV